MAGSSRSRIALLLAAGHVLPGVVAPHAAAREELETVQVTATRRPESAFEVPAATAVIGREAIRAAPLQTVMDALRGSAGAWVQQTTPGQGVVILRGLKGSEVLHLVDGFRLNNALFRNAPNQYVALVDAQALERIEVVRGPMSALYGSDAMGGVVHMLSWEPDFPAHEEWSARGLLRSSYASADRSLLSRAEGVLGRAGIVISGGLSYQDVGERRIGGGERLAFTDYRASAADLKLRVQPGEQQELMLSLQYSEQPRTPRYDELSAGYGQSHPASALYLFAPQQRELLHLRWRNTSPTAAWDSTELHLGRQHVRDDRRTRDHGSDSEDIERNRDTTLGASFQALKALGDGHHLAWGADFYEDAIDAARERLDIDTGERSIRVPRFPDDSSMRQLGVFLADDWQAGARTDVHAALRWSAAQTELPDRPGIPGVTTREDGFSANIGVAFALTAELRLVANLGRGFRVPNVFDLGTLGDRPGNRYNAPNAALEPETVTTVDGGLKLASAALDGELIGFCSHYRDKISSVLTGERTASGRLVVQNRNAAELDLCGIEFGLRARLGERLALFANSTWTRGDERIDGSVHPADRVPPLNGSLGIAWQALPAVAVDAQLGYAARQDRYSPRDAADPRIRPGSTPGWVSASVGASWRATPRLRAGLQLLNVADRRYREFGSGLDAPGFGWLLTVELER